MKRSILYIIIALQVIAGLQSCDDTSCTLENKVTMGISLYGDTSNTAFAVADTLTMWYVGAEDTILNKGVGTQSVRIPMSLWQYTDTLIMEASDSVGKIRDSVFISKTNTEYYESADCPIKMWHNIVEAKATGNSFISRIEIIYSDVNFSEVENLRIFIRQN